MRKAKGGQEWDKKEVAQFKSPILQAMDWTTTTYVDEGTTIQNERKTWLEQESGNEV